MADLLVLLQFGDSALPVGAFSFSHGLESATQQGLVTDAETLEAFVMTAVRQSAVSDGIALLLAHRAASAADLATLAAIDWATFERKLNEEIRLMTVRMGRKLAELAVAVIDDAVNHAWLDRIRQGVTPGTHPVSLAVAMASLGADPRDAFAAQHYGVATTILSAALRLMRLSFLDTQRILRQAMAVVPQLCEEVMDAGLDDMSGFAPMNDILAAIHVKSYVRMFMN